MIKRIGISLLISLALVSVVHAAFNQDLSISAGDIRVPDDIITGKTVRIYATIHNNSGQDLTGVVKFYDENAQKFLGTDQPISAVARKTDDVFVDWPAGDVGNHPVSVRVFPWSADGDDPGNDKVVKNIYVDKDTDGDGIGDRKDSDIDGDGVTNAKDAFPLDPKESVDTDHDGIGDNADTDDDNDGVPDIQDAFPKDSKETKDSDGDGVGDNSDFLPNDPTESKDSDGDGLGDNADTNDHNKGPVIGFAMPAGAIPVNQPFTFDATGSTDPDGHVARVDWTFDDGAKASGQTADHVFTTTGNHGVSLAVTDDKGESREKTFEVEVSATWQSPALLSGGAILLIFLFYWATRSRGKRPPAPHKKHLPKAKK